MDKRSGRRLRFFSPDGTFEEAVARFMKFALGAFFLASVIHLLLALRYGSGNVLRLDGTPVGMFSSLALWVVLWKWPHRLRLVVVVAYVSITVGLTFKLSLLVFLDSADLLRELLWMLPWVTISIVFSFVLFSGRLATVLSVTVLAVWAAISGVYVVSDIANPQGQQALLFFSQADLAEFVLIVFMGVFSRLLGLYLLSHKSAAHLEEMANTDFLLELPNRRSTQAALGRELQRARQTENMLSIAMMDVDQFKQVNDRFGHDAGDAVLTTVTRIVRETIPPTCVFGRWGGDEFLFVVPQLPRDAVITLVESVRGKVAEQRFDVGQVTVSLGIAELRVEDTVVSLLKRADRALYRAKELGRNRVEWEWNSHATEFLPSVQREPSRSDYNV
ncbi:GGDEF domain-containing protein [Alicyclobacillus sp. ALC3]|uniref:GGDEF domain-containing protein n=1 Tax=Alicyclobacillus sp. ALC3 TaxID=2796143 RepID=UPI0023795841|nr:GGDEF domain-containing protein [Alicyclobacillus sp. ALC3]WDL98316.1 GGDEF domain-containing protein [Alicyclobacillus sp. ALC3]